MLEPSVYRGVMARLAQERQQLKDLRSDYDRISQSRFHALRMLWFSLKQLLGRTSPDDLYAMWSPGFAPTLPALPAASVSQVDVELQDPELALVGAWNQRATSKYFTGTPIASVVIPVFNHCDATVRCLRSIAASWFDSLSVQFIIVDDGSSDETSAVVTHLSGVDYVRSGTNEGFVRACNRGAAIARGKYVCFLNNDTTVSDGWLDHLVVTAESDPTVGVVGAKLVYPDGRLQEAGSILWRDATGWNVGHLESPDDPRYNFVRDVDYVSGAVLLVRKDLFARTGGFSENYVPAYYEDADLCFQIREMGYRVVYQPRSTVVHYEGVTSGNEQTGIKRFQEVNRPKFCERWGRELASHLENDHANVVPAWRRGEAGRTILMIDSYVPLYDHEAGSQRMFHLIKLLKKSGYRIIFLPDNYAPLQPYTTELQQLGVEVLHHVEGGVSQQDSLNSVLPLVDFAWISRPELCLKYGSTVRQYPHVRLIYDTVDLSHVRKRRQSELFGEDDTAWRELLDREMKCTQSADSVVVVTPDEKEALESLDIRNVFVIPTIHEVASERRNPFEESAGLLFIGNYNHPPNVDAAQWLCEAVMPIVWQLLPDVHVTLVGSNPSQTLFALKSERVRVTGYVRDASSYFLRSRLFVAPLRFGAGMKGKIGQALTYALPVVTTPVGAEGLGLRDGENAVIVATDPHAFAEALVALYCDPRRWKQISDAAAETLQPFTPEAVAPQLIALFERLSSLQPA